MMGVTNFHDLPLGEKPSPHDRMAPHAIVRRSMSNEPRRIVTVSGQYEARAGANWDSRLLLASHNAMFFHESLESGALRCSDALLPRTDTMR
jgi:hypothetical protein